MGTPTGFAGLDTIITGLNKSDLILVAARPAMGKTSFALNIATNVASAFGQEGGGLFAGNEQGAAGAAGSFRPRR